jgi:hypothetical protein
LAIKLKVGIKEEQSIRTAKYNCLYFELFEISEVNINAFCKAMKDKQQSGKKNENNKDCKKGKNQPINEKDKGKLKEVQ